ncbi:MAG: type IV secretory system conjugative DNA transfer family protein [Clostridiales bacterium]|nr:type IV secretory system conjugative DNA transfer family protein [Clostridiales bacterium]
MIKYDPIVLGKDYCLQGSEVGAVRPNDNILADGCSGCGKSTNLLLPAIARMNHMNGMASYSKEEDAYMMGRFAESKGYRAEYLNLCTPSRSTVAFDPIPYLSSYSDVEALSTSIVQSVLYKTVDSFWNTNAIQLLNSLILANSMIHKKPGMAGVLKLFDKTVSDDFGSNSLPSDKIFKTIEEEYPECPAVREYKSWRGMPEKTANSVRATLKGALNSVFPEDVRHILTSRKQTDFEEMGREKMFLFIISDSANMSLGYLANLFWETALKELRKAADASPGHHLIRPIRLYFDDFACISAIQNFEKTISIMRSYGISCMILLQSQSQLESIYGADKASIIRQNCPVQVYFPGGFDDRSCELVSKRMNISYENVLYAPMGKVFIMAAGRKPAVVQRYDAFKSNEYQDYLKANRREPFIEMAVS